MEDPISHKKLLLNGICATTKEILGWYINGKDPTQSIIASKANTIIAAITTAQHARRLPVRNLETLHGLLQWLSDAIPTGKPLLGELRSYLHHCPLHPERYVPVPPHIKVLYTDWIKLVKFIMDQACQIHLLTPHSRLRTSPNSPQQPRFLRCLGHVGR